MHELDKQLEYLVQQAQKYPANSKERRKIIQNLWDTMLPSSTLRGRPAKPTDDEAKRRLAGVKKWCRDRYSAKLEGDFEEDWQDVLVDAQKEVLKNIDIYKKGVDSQLYQAWLNFCQTSPPQPNPEAYSEFQKQVEKFRNRFIQRRTKKKDGNIIPYPQEKVQRLSQICEFLGNRIQTNEVDLQQAWNDFCHEVQQLYRPFKFWNWFASYVKFRFFDIIRKRVKEVSLDAPAGQQNADDPTQTKLEKIQAKTNQRLSQQEMQLIYQDSDRIFRGKHIRNFPNVNFREIALLKFQEYSLEQINQHFNHQVDAQTTISPFYTRCCNYFKPILKEYLKADITLPQPVIEQILNDAEGKYNKRRMPGHSHITFKGIIESRLGGVASWKILAQQLNLDVRDLIYFYLDAVSYFKLITKPKTRTRNNKKNNPPIDE
jgi:hypothetical protein